MWIPLPDGDQRISGFPYPRAQRLTMVRTCHDYELGKHFLQSCNPSPSSARPVNSPAVRTKSGLLAHLIAQQYPKAVGRYIAVPPPPWKLRAPFDY